MYYHDMCHDSNQLNDTDIWYTQRARFFPEDYAHTMSEMFDPFYADFCKFQTVCEQSTTTHPGTSRDIFVNTQTKLSENDVIHIFLNKKIKTSHTATRLANQYGVTAKTIRSIWTHRARSNLTQRI